ncbi:cell wall anchor protein [Barnesiella sp. WM24]|uniref:cell wall anchor protein n=1 Tax=Barnesiella sp. WM24 TaxID=2558278 RepID=UPI0010729ECA|nr:cell wall anchor protein [Barnesiella sp. WM24]TFU93632.1 cell wall anchor protein [Barnesiella sp. WM24]
MSKSIIISLIIAIAGLAVSDRAAAAPVSVKASLDSAYILMGKQTVLNLEIVQDRGTQGAFINNSGDTLTREVEVIRAVKPDTTDLGNNREEIKRELVIQSFDSGLYTIPPFVYVAGKDTFTSNALALKVIPVPVDSMATIHDYAGVVKPNTRIWDYLPDFIVDYWWIFIIVLLCAAGIFVWMRYIKGKKAIPLVPKKKPVPPYELAMQQLNRLKSEKLCENGHEKEYYTRLTEILRIYLDKRFGINAMEMTSTQIMHHLQSNDDTRTSAPVMKQILEMADFVKFAKVRPLPDDNQKAFNNAVTFVENTKPVEPTEAVNDNPQPKVTE